MKNPIFFKKLASQKSMCEYFENFQNLIALQVWYLVFTKNFEKLSNGTVLGQNSLNRSGVKYAKNHKIQRVNHISCGGYLNALFIG